MKNKLLCALLIACMTVLIGCGEDDAAPADATEAVAEEITTEDASVEETETEDALIEDVEEMTGALSEERQTALMDLLDEHHGVVADTDIDVDYDFFLCGKKVIQHTYEGNDEPSNITCFVHFDEGFGDLYLGQTSYALIDVNGDGVDELYYRIDDGGMDFLSFLITVKDGNLALLDSDESHTPFMGSWLNTDGILLCEGSWQDENMDYYEAYSFDEDGNKNLIDALYASDCESLEDYQSKLADFRAPYEENGYLDMQVLSEAKYE